jgi:hypothetical protein
MKQKPNVWKYRLRDAFSWRTSIAPNFRQWQYDTVFFTDAHDRLWLTIGADGTISIEPEYTWDGCSPKFKWGWLLFGTPDGAPNPVTGYPYTYYASLIHDALLQWEDDPRMPYSRDQIDVIFREKLRADGFPAAQWYYHAVRLFTRWKGFWRWLDQLRMGL